MQTEPFIGRQIDDYIIQERIGVGGMATVYRAYQPSVNRSVALKVITLSAEEHERREFRARFAQEAEMIASLEHIHILPIYDYGVTDDIAFIAMRLLRGGTLSSLMADGPLTLDRTADLFTQIARGLHHAHKRSIIHRDIKPSNILLDENQNAYLTDFGLAKMIGDSLDVTRSGSIVGTPQYMSPEQLRGEETDSRSDIYSLGIVLYQMLIGYAPFNSSDNNIVSIIYQHLEKLPEPPSHLNADVTPPVEAVILRALAKSRDERFASAEIMADELNIALGRKGSSTNLSTIRPTGSPPPAPAQPEATTRPARRLPLSRTQIAVALVALSLLIGVGVYAVVSRPPAAFSPPNVLKDETGTSEAAVPTGSEITVAQAHAGATGFIAYIACNQSSEYHATQAREMGDFAERYDLAYRVYDSDSDKSRQIPLIERARAEGAALLIVCPLDVILLDQTLMSAQAAGLPMVFMHSDIPSYGGVRLAGNDYLMGYGAGRLAGEIVRDELGGTAQIAVLGYPDLPSIVVRAQGMKDALLERAPNAEIVAEGVGATQEFAQETVAGWIEDGITFDGILSINDAGSFGAIRALEAAGIAPDEVFITSIDAEVLAREYISQGYYLRGSVDVGREAFSQTAIDAAVKLLAGATVPETFLVPPGDVVTFTDDATAPAPDAG